MSARWHILTPELPPRCGGVGDYVAMLAPALAAARAGSVTVWAPPGEGQLAAVAGVEIVRLPDRFGPGSRRALAARLDAEGPDTRLLVQYVANAYGLRGANIPFSRWVRDRGRTGQDVRVMFHEPYLSFRWRPDHFAVAAAQRVMARHMVRASSRLLFSTATWRRYLSRFDPAAVERATVLPIPSAIPRLDAPARVAAARRAALGGATHLVGHFGTYGRLIAPALAAALVRLLASDPSVTALCIGGGSQEFAADLVRRHPVLAGRIGATGRAPASDVSLSLQACDLLVQPYPDGVTTRRTSVMAGLANGVAVLTSDGPLTEPVWRASGAVACAPAGDARALSACATQLLGDGAARAALGLRGLKTYEDTFELRHTIAALVADEAHG